MGILKYAVLGAAVAYGITHITKKRETDGKSILDDIQEKSPEWMDKIKAFAEDTLNQAENKSRRTGENYQGY